MANLNKVNPKMLYDSGKHIVWVVVVEAKSKGDWSVVSSTTAFVVGEKGLLLTSARGEWNSRRNIRIKCRPLGMADFKYKADIVSIRPELDMCLLQVQNIEFCYVAQLGKGDLAVGDRVMQIGHPSEVVGLGCLGTVVYDCIEDVVCDFDTQEKCKMYIPTTLTSTPRYMIMGDTWNKHVFQKIENSPNPRSCKFEKGFLAKLPIIMCKGMIAAEGSLGSPVFNVNGEVVGMLVLGSDLYGVAIHVTAIKAFIKLFSEGSKEDASLDSEEPVDEEALIGASRKRKSTKN